MGAGAAPATWYAPTVHAPVEGRVEEVRVLPRVVSLHSATRLPVQRAVRLVPVPMATDPVCGIPNASTFALETAWECVPSPDAVCQVEKTFVAVVFQCHSVFPSVM